MDRLGELAEAFEDMVRNEEIGFGASLALDKLAITGSSEMVVQLLRRRLGRLAGPDPGVNAAAANLGIDFRPGQARGKVKQGKWLQRLAKADARAVSALTLSARQKLWRRGASFYMVGSLGGWALLGLDQSQA